MRQAEASGKGLPSVFFKKMTSRKTKHRIVYIKKNFQSIQYISNDFRF